LVRAASARFQLWRERVCSRLLSETRVQCQRRSISRAAGLVVFLTSPPRSRCVGCFFRILVSRPVSTISGLALVVRYWKATLGDLRRRSGTRSSQSLMFAVAMKGTPRRYGRRARPDRRLDAEKNSNPPEAGDRPLGGGPGCHIVRVGALELSEKHLAGEQLSSLARGRPAGYGGAPAARAEVWARKQTASRQPKRVS